MQSDVEIDRRKVTFRQAEGLAPLPTQLAPRTLSREVRAKLWSILHGHIVATKEEGHYDNHVGRPWNILLLRWHVSHEHQPSDEFENRLDHQLRIIKAIIWDGNYADVFEFLTFIIRDRDMPQRLDAVFANILEETRCAYRIVDRTVFPIASEAEGSAVVKAFSDLSTSEFQGARAHLREAGNFLQSGEWGDSIRESIHAVEAVARVIEPGAKTLDQALKRLKMSSHIHPALAEGFGKLYGYTNDEQGIRHPILEADRADESDALYMVGACAAFVSYLIARRPRS